jgi:hypothetical protein
MNENEKLANMQENPAAENVEQTTEETPKMYTEDELNAKVNDIVGKRIARKEAKIRKEYDRKYGNLESVLRAGMGKDNVEEMTDTFRDFYQKKGITMPTTPTYSDADTAVLARAEAEDIISGGYDEVVEEVDRLSALGVENMTAREKEVFRVLANHRHKAETAKSLAEIGVTEDVIESEDFKNFAAKFSNPATPVREVYELYRKTQPAKEHKTMGSMKNSTATEPEVKDFYSADEARKFTRADFDRNPKLFEAVCNSMTKWK